MTERTDAELERKPRLEWHQNKNTRSNSGLMFERWIVTVGPFALIVHNTIKGNYTWNIECADGECAAVVDSEREHRNPTSAQLAAEDALAQIADNINNALGRKAP